MNKTFATFLSAALFAVSAATASADDATDYRFEYAGGNASEWWRKEKFGYLEGFYAPLKLKDFDETVPGGGGAIAGEYVNKDTHFGLGGRFGMVYGLLDSIKHERFGYLDLLAVNLGLDVYVPVRPVDFLTLYAGGGFAYQGLDFTADNGGTIKGGDLTGSLFAGGRLRWFHIYVFGEYRQQFGEVEIEATLTNFQHYEEKIDVSGGIFRAGAGFVF